MAEVTHPPLDGKSGKPVLLALVPRDPLLPGPMGVAAAQPGEAGVKHHRFTELRGLQVCRWPVPSLTQALVHPAISRLNCAPYQDSIREAQAAAHSCQAGGPLRGGASPHPLCLYLRTALSAALCGSLLLSLPEARAHSGLWVWAACV